MGITLSAYEEEFFERMAGYLPARSTSAVFGPVGLALISLVAVGTAVAASICGVRSSPAAATAEGATEVPARTRGSRIGFTTWIAATSVLTLGLFLLGVYAFGRSWELTDSDKTLGVAVLIAYLAFCAAVFTWAVRRRRQHSASAWPIPLLAIGAAAVTVVVINQNF
jgi:hypothetical protein